MAFGTSALRGAPAAALRPILFLVAVDDAGRTDCRTGEGDSTPNPRAATGHDRYFAF